MPEAILAIRSRALGDLVLLTPALRALRAGHPGAALEVVTEARYAPLLEGIEGIDRVWALERSQLGTLRLAAQLRRGRYAWAVDFFGNSRSTLLAVASGARRIAGFDVRGRERFYHVRAPRAVAMPPGRREYTAEAHVRLAAAAGGRADGEGPRLDLTAASRAAGARALAEARVAEPGRTVGLVAFGSWPTKTWPLGHAIRLALRLSEHGHPLVLLAGPGETRVAEAMRRFVPDLRVLPPCGPAALAGAIGLLRAVVGTESGPRHVAVALDVPTYTWFGPTHPDSWTPPDPRHGFWQTSLPCRACDRTRCPHWNCLPSLDPEEAARRVITHLDAHGRTTARLDPAARA
jgi:ADP-heptose:LPS heptosyltransferase